MNLILRMISLSVLLVGLMKAQLPTAIVFRTFAVKFGKMGGTGFFYEQGGKHFFITAKHVVPTLDSGGKVIITNPKTLEDIPMEIEQVINCGPNDVVVLLPKSQDFDALRKFPLKAARNGNYFLGDFAFFAGFPLGTRAQMDGPEGKFLAPFIKRASLALPANMDGQDFLFLDGVNTPGFSGGPLYKLEGSGSNTEVAVLGVISAYRGENVPVYSAGQPTQFWVSINSGIVVAHPIKVVIDAIEAHFKK